MADRLSARLRRLIARAARRSHAARSAREERLAYALEGSNDGLWDLDMSSGTVYLSPRSSEILGLGPDELTLMAATWDQLVHPDDLPRTQAALAAHLDGGSPTFEVEHRLRTATGDWKWVARRGRAVARDAGGAPTRMAGMISDISARRSGEDRLLASEEGLRLAVDVAGLGIFDINVQTGEISVNEQFPRMLGDDPAAFRPSTAAWMERLHPDERDTVAGAYRDLIAGNRPEYRTEFRQRTLSGEWTWVMSLARVVERDAGGAPLRIVGMYMDIAERKRAEEQLRANVEDATRRLAGEARARRGLLSIVEDQRTTEAALRESEAKYLQLNEALEQRVIARTAELQNANAELESFSYTVSHDLRAPLRAINGFAAMLARHYRQGLDEKGRHYVDTIVASSDHMGTLIEDLLAYSRMGRHTVRAEPVPLGPLVSQLRSTFADRFEAAGGTLEVIEPLAVPLGDPMLLERVLVNLVDNALTYRRSDIAPHVTLSATRRRRTVTLAVADNGIGIAPEYHERVFEVFARLHNDDEYSGTGIGLSIVRKAARLMGSNVTLESTEGAGSTFRLELPAAQERTTPS